MKKIFLSLGVFAFLLVLVGAGCESLEQLTNEEIEGEKIIGGERDEHDCLSPAGYTWDEDLEICARSWEIKEENNRKAVKIAAPNLGEQKGLTVVDVEVEEGEGCYIVHFTNFDNEQLEVELKNWEIFTGDDTEEEKKEEEEEIEKKEEVEEVVKKEELKPGSGISLYAKAVEGGVQLSWSMAGINVDKGFKLVKSLEANPVYPGDSYVYLSNSGARSYTWNIKDGKTYYFRVCQYLGGKCGIYSQNVKVTTPLKKTYKEKETTGSVSSISLKSTGGTGVSWTVNGTSSKGFKVVWSKNSSPTYPTRSGDKYIYLSDKNASATSLKAFDGSGKYYVRVCEYFGGKCGVYSNQITVEL